MRPRIETEKHGLVIEEGAGPRAQLGRLLEEEGWVPRLAGSFDEALELAFWHSPDLVILNVDIAPVQELRELLDELRLVALLAFSLVTTGTSELANRGGGLGQVAYLPQPVRREDFRRLAIRTAEARRRGVSLVRDSQQALARLAIVRRAMERRLRGWRDKP